MELVLACFLALVALAMAEQKVPLTVEDMIKMHRLGGPTLSPDGETFVYTETEYKPGLDSSIGHLYLSNINNPDLRTDICPEACSSKGNPTFLTSNILLFTGVDSETAANQAWWVDLSKDTNNCIKITSFKTSIDNLIIANANSKYRLLFSAEVYFGMGIDETLEEEKKKAESGAEYSLYRDGYMRHWDTWFEQDKWVHTFSAPFTFTEKDGVSKIEPGTEIDITATVAGDVPMRPFGDRSGLSVSPDGTRVAYVTQDTNSKNKPNMTNPSSVQFETNDAIYIIDVEGKGTPVCVTCDPHIYIYSEARAAAPQWLEDNEIYFLGMKEAQSESDKVRLALIELPTEESYTQTYTVTFLTEDYDFGIGSYTRDINNKNIFWLTVTQNAYTRLIRFDKSQPMESGNGPINPRSTPRYTIVTKYGDVSSPQQTNDGRIIFGYNSYSTPAEVYILKESDIDGLSKLDAEEEIPMEHLTHEFEQRVPKNACIQRPKVFYVEREGAKVQSFYFLPCGFDENDKSVPPPPLILYVHGGPESPWSDDWSYRWNPQAILGQGYSMVLTNFHGSDSFGDKFTKSIRQNWYNTPYQDVLDGLRYMIENGLGDPNRVGAMGASYGGTFMNWLNGHNDPVVPAWTDRNNVHHDAITVKVIITHDGIFDLRHFGYDTDETFFPAREFDGYPENETIRQYYERDNPANHTANWRTPTLVIQGGCDYRIFTNHGLSVFQSLKMQGVDAQLLYFPTQSHWVYQTQESAIWHATVLAWLAAYLQPTLY